MTRPGCMCWQLGADFPVRFEGSHVVNLQEQVWAAALPRPFNAQPLTVTRPATPCVHGRPCLLSKVGMLLWEEA